MATIPTKLKEIAEDLGCNTINFVTTTTEGDIYSLAETDSSGNYLPIGQPILYAVKGSTISEVPESRVPDILSNIKE